MPLSESVVLPGGAEMRRLGLGTWLSDPGVVGSVVQSALELGYRHIDCAMAYGNQAEIGQALTAQFKLGKVKREEVFITSKIWNTFHSSAKAAEAVDSILRDLQLDYLDLCLIHWPMGYLEGGDIFPFDSNGKMQYADTDFMDTWRALESAVKAGKVKNIGVSNFNSTQLQRIIDEGSIPPAVLQIEIHPYFAQNELVAFCKARSVAVTAYSPLANPTHKFRNDGQPLLLEETILNEISKTHGKTPAQVALRWSIQRGNITIPKSVTAARLQENLNVFDFELSHAEMDRIATLDKGWRILDLQRDVTHKDFPFHAPF